MTQTVQIHCSYYAGVNSEIELPEGKTWDDVVEWWIEQDHISIKFKDGTEVIDQFLDSDETDAIDYVRPIKAAVYKLDENGYTINPALDKWNVFKTRQVK